MIRLEKLSSVREIITHAHCPDGVASALILRDVFPEIPVTYLQYGALEHRELEAREGMLFCDFSPPEGRVQEFVDKGAIVLDHHKTAKAVVEQFGENGVYGDETLNPGVSGATLAFQVWKMFYHNPIHRMSSLPVVERFALLAGIRDTWQRTSPHWEEACAQAEVLKFFPSSAWDGVRFFDPTFSHRMALGPLLTQKKLSYTAELVSQCVQFTLRDKRVAIIQGTSVTSDLHDTMSREVDLLVGFHYQADQAAVKMILSCRASNFDTAAFCNWVKTRPGGLSGGGHTKAAGCSFLMLQEDPNPYAKIKALLEEYLG